MGNKVVKQHFVQRKYLEIYSGAERIHVFDKRTRKTFPSNVRDVANERYFYDVPELDEITGESQFLEKYFHPFETSAPEVMIRLISALEDGSFTELAKEDRNLLATYFALQYLRTKESRVASIEVVEKILAEMAFAISSEELSALGLKKGDIVAKVIEDKIPAFHAAHILNEELRDEIAEILKNHIWLIVVNTTATPFYTSDHPLVKYGHIKHAVLAMNGLGSPGVEVDFPLSSKYLLSMVDRTHFKQHEAKDGKRHEISKEETITWYNHLQVYQSYRQVLCNAPNFALVEEMIEKNPKISNIDYDRVQVS